MCVCVYVCVCVCAHTLKAEWLSVDFVAYVCMKMLPTLTFSCHFLLEKEKDLVMLQTCMWLLL